MATKRRPASASEPAQVLERGEVTFLYSPLHARTEQPIEPLVDAEWR